MPRSFFLLNIILFIIIGLLGIKLYKTWSRPLEIPILAPRKAPAENGKDIVALRKKAVNESAFDVIVQKDLFRPSRTPVQKDVSASQAITSTEKPQLFGTTIMGELKSAILEDPSTKTTKLYRVNDSIGGFTVSDILENKVILSMGGSTVEVKLRDNKDFKPPKPVVTEQRAPQRTPRRTAPRRRVPARERAAPEKEDATAR